MDERERPAERFSSERSHLRAVVYGIPGFSASYFQSISRKIFRKNFRLYLRTKAPLGFRED